MLTTGEWPAAAKRIVAENVTYKRVALALELGRADQAVIDHVHANGQKFGLYFIPGISPAVYQAAYPIANAPGCTTHDIVKQPLRIIDGLVALPTAPGLGVEVDEAAVARFAAKGS